MIFHDDSNRRKRYILAGLAVIGVIAIFILLRINSILSTDVADIGNLIDPARLDVVNGNKQVVLTFDDGPHPEHTRAILKILEQYNVPAVFFIVGSAAVEHPDIVREIYEAGHEIGNHSYSHAREVHDSPERIRYELLTTNHLIEQITGHRTILYRPPFLMDFWQSPEEIIAAIPANATSTVYVFSTISDLGYLGISSKVDSLDWQANGTAAILNNTFSSLEYGNIILLHDGIDSSGLTEETLPTLIEELRATGYELVSLSEYLNIPKETLMPPSSGNIFALNTEFALISSYINSRDIVFPAALTFVLSFTMLRGLILIALFLRRRPAITKKNGSCGVSILIPAYNEKENIRATLKSISENEYKPRQIIIIDDGSNDNTADIVKQILPELQEDVVFIQKNNGGKCSALNMGLEYAKYEILIAIDGDTVFASDAIQKMVRHFNDPEIGAVAGKIETAGEGIVPLLQNIEYTLAQNIEKTAFWRANAIGVVPGAIGAWRRVDVMLAGGYSSDTMVEDQDLTYAMHKLGRKVAYEPAAIAYTEVPSNTKDFMSQRFRWMYGSLQCLYKYRTSFFNSPRASFGFFLLPYNFIYSVAVPFFGFLVLFMSVIMIVHGRWQELLYIAAVFMCIDVIYACIGFAKDPRKLSYIVYLPILTLYYRTIITFIFYLCIIRILAGTHTYWHKLKRTGSAQLYHEYLLLTPKYIKPVSPTDNSRNP